MVARAALSNIRQGHEEPTRSFYARIKGQADTCKYEMKCSKEESDQVNDFTEEILRNEIARGIADQQVQLDLLGKKNEDMALKCNYSAPQLVCNLIINVIRNIISLLHNIKLIF